MNRFAFAVAAFFATFFPFTNSSVQNSNIPYDALAVKKKFAVSCTPDRMAIAALLADNDEITLMPGSGSYDWKIDTKSDSAQLYFKQGINMYYGFHIIEAIASFKKAAKFDSTNAMIWWAQGLAAGPNINDVGYTASPEALSVTQKAAELSSNATPVEKALINAMTRRYTADTTQSRESLNQAYVDAMKETFEKFSGNVDVMALYADAMMLQHPWDLWTTDGMPKPWQPAIQQILEKAIAKDPMHPGANHYYIHIMEASPQPGKALHSASVLGSITPGLSHLVHMPSHIYLRTGDFDKGVTNNIDAIKTFKNYSTLFPAANANAFIYYWHNLHMLANCAMLAGRYHEAITSATELSQQLDTATLASPAPLGSFLYYMYMTPMLVNVRFEKWDDVLNMKQPDNKYIYANVLYHFGRGMALAGKGNFSDAEKETASMEELMKDESLKIPMSPFSPVSEGSMVALETLKGFISLKNDKVKDAITHFQLASDRESNMVYTEPRDWILNPHQYLGTALLADKNDKAAELAFKTDLKKNAKNVWSLSGLEKALRAQGKKKEATSVAKELKTASAKSDAVFN